MASINVVPANGRNYPNHQSNYPEGYQSGRQDSAHTGKASQNSQYDNREKEGEQYPNASFPEFKRQSEVCVH